MNDRIIKALSGFYYVQTPDGVVECRARGRFRKEGVSPLVGDFVRISRSGKSGTVEEILPRKNSFIRPAVANVDLLVLLASCAIPQTEPFLIDRVLAIAGQQGVEPLICVNKNDLEPGASLAGIYERAGFRVIVTSAETGEGMDELHAAISGKLSAFTGNSGVGKSSILNKLCPELHLAVGEVSEKLGRGRHTTRHIELYALGDDTFVADTPGFSSFDTERMDLVLKEQLPEAFSDFAPYLGKCQFPDCAHLKEPGCAVRAALEQGKIEPTRYDSYRRLYELAKDIKPWELKERGNLHGFTGNCLDGSGVGCRAAAGRQSQLAAGRLSLPARLASDSCDGALHSARDPEKRTKVNRQNRPQALPAGSFLLACGHIGELFA